MMFGMVLLEVCIRRNVHETVDYHPSDDGFGYAGWIMLVLMLVLCVVGGVRCRWQLAWIGVLANGWTKEEFIE